MQHQAETHQAEKVLLVMVSCPPDKADGIALELLEADLAACINVVPLVKSLYHWQGKVQQDNESLMLIKCAAINFTALQERILDTHPYELPEIITVSVSGGLPAYLDWVVQPNKNNSE